MDLSIGSVIKRLRAEHSVTQEALAAYLGISFQAVSQVSFMHSSESSLLSSILLAIL